MHVTVAGRQVPYAVWGDRDGFPVVVLHGTPGSRLGRFSDEAALAATGVRQVEQPAVEGRDMTRLRACKRVRTRPSVTTLGG